MGLEGEASPQLPKLCLDFPGKEAPDWRSRLGAGTQQWEDPHRLTTGL